MHNLSLEERLVLDLFAINAIKFGSFTLKSGVVSPFYFDLRLLVSYSYLLQLVSDVLWQKMQVLYFDVIIGVPYTGIPIATTIAIKQNQHMIFVRKEQKTHGTKQLIEGQFHKGQKALLVDDVITNGESKLETIQPLENAGLKVEDIVILVDRGQGGPEFLKKKGYRCHTVFQIEVIFQTLLKYKRVPKQTIDESLRFIKKSRKQFFKR